MRPKILIIEDDNIIQLFLANVIQELGYDLIGMVNSCENALLTIEKQIPDLILMDVGIRGNIDGVETAKIITKQAQVPIAFITGNTDLATYKRILSVNPVEVIKKPIDDLILKRELKSIFKKLELDIDSE